MEFDEEEDKPISEWLYDNQPLVDTKHVNGTTYRTWNLSLPQIACLYRMANQVIVSCRVVSLLKDSLKLQSVVKKRPSDSHPLNYKFLYSEVLPS